MSKHPQDVDVAFIEALAELLNRNGLSELSVKREYGEDDSLEVRVARQLAPVAAAPVAAPPVMVAQAAAPAAVAVAPAPAPSDDPAQHPGCLTSPMVGTAYLSPEPGTPPFVALGAQVAAGQTVLIIEAMKTMNQIPAPRAGTLRRILIEDGTPVEYGAPLMIID
ncbi:MAG: acetyl-CoA carboxylase biotin carboxyl carrier protein [Alphaproteobacteria bacterium]|nr:acetyl-CoA carboxylase biotin carboxyl carrier protein [Alphaproteobacteria bacterium]